MSVDNVRLLTGDTDATDELLTDAQINFFLSEHGDQVYLAASEAASAIAAKFARQADKSVDDVSLKASQKHKQYMALSEKLRKQAREQAVWSGTPYAGGISKSDKDTRESDTDRTVPAFTRESHFEGAKNYPRREDE